MDHQDLSVIYFVYQAYMCDPLVGLGISSSCEEQQITGTPVGRGDKITQGAHVGSSTG
jgi:hypothetical protein